MATDATLLYTHHPSKRSVTCVAAVDTTYCDADYLQPTILRAATVGGKALPNILLIMSDEHSPRTMGCYGADFARTPNLDRLASLGTTFDNAYCAFPLCVPSRNALMSGLDCHKIQAYDNGSPLRCDLPTWAHMLARAGYRSVLDGKMHFLGADQLHGFYSHANEPAAEVDGFRWGEETGNGGAYIHFLRIHFTDETPPENQGYNNYALDISSRDYALDFLRSTPKDQPFCLTVSFNYPHYPMVCDRDVYESYIDATIPEPLSSEGLHQRNDHLGNCVWGFNKFAKAETRNARRAYLTMVTMLDGWIGEIMHTLQDNALWNDTFVVYTSDHGDMWGEHGMWGKNVFYEDSVRVPLIVAGPRFGIQAGRRIATPVSLLDLYPTFRDASAIEDWDVPLDGRSLWPALTLGKELEDRPVFSSYYASDVKGPERMIRYRQFKLNYYHQQGMELFDLENDPNEQANLIDDHRYQTTRDELLAMLMDSWEPEAIAKDIRTEQNRRTYIGESLRKIKGKSYRSGL